MSRGRTILFADDEPHLQDALHAVLEAEGFRCLSCSSMTEAVKALHETEIAVLVTDIMMPAGPDFPEIDSATTGHHLVDYTLHHFPGTAIICLSVIGEQRVIDRLKRKGVLFLRKGETPLEKAVQRIKSKATGIFTPGQRNQ